MKIGSYFTLMFIMATGCSDEFKSGGKFNSDNHSNALSPSQESGDLQPEPNINKAAANPDTTFSDGKDYGPYQFGEGEPKKELFDGSGILGVETKLVSISFEDGSDNDYNDVSFCFEGLFKVDNKSVVFVAPEEKEVKVTVKRLTGHYAIYTLKIFDENNVETYSKESHLATMGQTEVLNISLKPGSKIQTKYDKAGDYHDLPGSKSRVLIDKCMNTGS